VKSSSVASKKMSELRKRNTAAGAGRGDWNAPTTEQNTLLEALKKADVFPKMKPQSQTTSSHTGGKSAQIKTPFGAAGSIPGVFLRNKN
jgi:hypothetical protein